MAMRALPLAAAMRNKRADTTLALLVGWRGGPQAFRRPNMSKSFNADDILQQTVSATPRVPGVVAMVTDRDGNLYEGAAGVRRLDRPDPMTTDSVFALFSTTKAITSTAALQLVEEGRLDLDAPASRYAPDIGALQVIDGFEPDGEPRLRAPKRAITARICCCIGRALAMISSTKPTGVLPKNRASPASLPHPRPR